MIIHRLHLLLAAGLFAFSMSGALQPAGADSAAVEVAQGGNIMQCMEQCIRSEGKSEKDTCKSRCANLSTRQAQPRNCMGIFKSCKKNCAKADRACQKACKDALMSCS